MVLGNEVLDMTRVTVIGGGPAGLSAALFTAKNALDTSVFDTDDTWMHRAHLFNYLGIRSVSGSEYMALARGQIQDRGGELHMDTEVKSVEQHSSGFTVQTATEEFESTYVVLATGANRELAEKAGCTMTEDDIVDVSLSMETSIDNLYATGAMVREQEWQAIIAAGDGAAAALSILGKEKGSRYHDFDTPADVPSLQAEE